MKKQYEELLWIIKQAGEIMLSAGEDISCAVKEKAGDAANMVTKYDVAVQNFLIENISAYIPDAYFFAEEKENEREALMRETCFIIDPIDGTANFVYGYRHSCISVALFSHGEAVFGAVYNPYTDEMFSAERGGGAYLNGSKISVAQRDISHAMLVFGTAPYNKDLYAAPTFMICKRIFEKCSDVRRSGSAALDLAYVAAGRYDMFFECKLSPWDFAAGYLLITEAGGVVTDMSGGAIDFSAPSSVIAATPSVYGELLLAVRE